MLTPHPSPAVQTKLTNERLPVTPPKNMLHQHHAALGLGALERWEVVLPDAHGRIHLKDVHRGWFLRVASRGDASEPHEAESSGVEIAIKRQTSKERQEAVEDDGAGSP